MSRALLRVVVSLALLVAPLAAGAQPTEKVARVGILKTQSLAAFRPFIDAFRQELRQLGYVEGQNISLELGFADGQLDRLDALAVDLVRQQVDIIVTGTNQEVNAAKRATKTIPIVVAASHDPVGVGLVESIARPGGNITGNDSIAPELDAKRLQLLKEVVPRLSHVAVVYNPADPAMRLHLRWTEEAAETLGIKVQAFEVRNLSDFDTVFAAMTRKRPGAIMVFTDPFTFLHRNRILDYAKDTRLPGMYEFKQFVEAGGLMSYGPDIAELWRGAAHYVAKILKGARPAELPIQRPTKFGLFVNLKTAKALGLTIPPSVLVLANEIIQ